MYTRPQLSPLCLQFAHSMVLACYPGSFITPILLVVVIYSHRNYAGRELIAILNTLGLSDDCKEVQRLNTVFLSKDNPDYHQQKFAQLSSTYSRKSNRQLVWISFVSNVHLPRLFIFAEFTGNWEFQLFCRSQMINLFHASGHFVYAKSAHIYLHQLTHVQESMVHLPYEKFTEKKVLRHKKQAVSEVEFS